jgi:hypothetical protein
MSRTCRTNGGEKGGGRRKIRGGGRGDECIQDIDRKARTIETTRKTKILVEGEYYDES